MLLVGFWNLPFNLLVYNWLPKCGELCKTAEVVLVASLPLVDGTFPTRTHSE